MDTGAAREKLSEALRAFDAESGAGIPDDELAAALLPVVREIAADELRAAADDPRIGYVARHIRDRADALGPHA